MFGWLDGVLFGCCFVLMFVVFGYFGVVVFLCFFFFLGGGVENTLEPSDDILIKT